MKTPPNPIFVSLLSRRSLTYGLTFTSSLSRLSPHLVSRHSQSLTTLPRHSLGQSVSHLVPSPRSLSRSRAPAFASAAAEADETNQAASAPSGGGRLLMSQSWNQLAK
ncbi:hypothetical protein AHAS_Ahas17G0162800 [Arachis hypogaea]